jgi:hypothetical protein
VIVELAAPNVDPNSE